MPRYFFHVHDGEDYPDEEGAELPGIEEARQYALRYAGQCLLVPNGAFWSGGEGWSLEVTDDRGLILFTLHFVATEAPAVSRGNPRDDIEVAGSS